MGYQRAVAQDVAHANTAIAQRPRHQKTSVTVKRILLGAHERDVVLLCPLDDAIQSFAELRNLRHSLVIGYPFAVEGALVGPPAKLLSKKHVGNSFPPKLVMQLVAIEMGSVP